MGIFKRKKDINTKELSNSDSLKKKINFSFSRMNRKQFKRNKDNNIDHEAINKKLIYSLSPHKVPNFKQIKYFKKVLSPRERILVSSLIFLVLASFVYFLVDFYIKNVETNPVAGGTYTEAVLGMPTNINPLYDLARDVDKDLSSLVYSSLFTRDSQGILVPDLVSEYSISEDSKVYSFTIRDDVKWHHGENLNVDDIVFTFEAILNPEYRSPLRSSFLGSQINKVDDYNFTITLTEPYAAFLDLLIFGIVPMNVWSTINPANFHLAENNVKPIGSGPYVFQSLAKTSSGDVREMSFVANEDYYGKVPYITNLNFRFYSYFEEMMAALNNGVVDGISYLPHGMRSQLISPRSLNFNSLNLPQISSVFFKQTEENFLNVKEIRRALALSIDRQRLIEEILESNAGPAFGPILPSNFAYNDEINKYEYNIEEAKKILEELEWLELEITSDDYAILSSLVELEANPVEEPEEEEGETETETELEEGSEIEEVDSSAYLEYQTKLEELTTQAENIENLTIKKKIINDLKLPDFDIVGTWRYKGENYLKITLTTVNLADNIDSANFIKNNWESIGVKTFVNIIDSAQIQTEIVRDKNFEALLLSQVVGNDPDSYVFWHSSQSGEGGLNITSYRNRDVDTLLEEARTILNVEERIEKYKEFQRLINEDIPAVFLYFPTYTYVQNNKIKGFDVIAISNPADRFSNIENWYIKTKRKLNF